MRPEGAQLSAAEAAAHQGAFQYCSYGVLARDLYMHRPAALANLRAIGVYNRFLADYENLYTDTTSVASVAVVKDDTNFEGMQFNEFREATPTDAAEVVPVVLRGTGYLNRLAANRLLYDIHYADKLRAEALAPYPFVVLLGARNMSDGAAGAVEEYLRGGGTVVAMEDASLGDETGKARADFALSGVYGFSVKNRPTRRAVRAVGRGRLIYYPQHPSPEALVADLRSLNLHQAVECEGPSPVLYNVRRKGDRLIVHLLNYDDAATYPVRLRLTVAVGGGRELSPDHPEVEPVVQKPSGEIEIPRLKRYSVLVLEKGAGELPASTHSF
jgi:hypothetical protein